MISKVNKLIRSGSFLSARLMLEAIKYNTPVVNYLISSQYIENKINKVSEKNTNIDDSGGEISYADKKYIHDFSLEWPELKNQICSQLNFNWKHPELIRKDHGETILNTIVSANYDPHMIEMYLSEREGLFKHRQDNEYSIIRQNPCKLFPYKYLTDYACKTAKELIDYKSAKISHTSISFIYCVKNRSERLRLSLETLISSLREASIKYEILIIEDKSENLFNGLPHAQCYKYVKHFVVDTKIAWTRSGLLNVGIKNASHEWVAFLDVDFLFGREFGSALERTLAFCDPNKLALVVNSIETETHLKENVAYSAGSPYGYMWMCGRAQAINVNGFDEGFQGHGFEDRDFQDKLLKLAKLSIIDSLSFDDCLYVFHLSHFVRRGSDNRGKNRERYIKRSESVAELLKNSSSDWGNYEILAIHNYLCEPEDDRLIEQSSVHTQHRGIALPKKTTVNCDYLFIPHNKYHGKTLSNIAISLNALGFNCKLLKISPPNPDEGAYIPEHDDLYVTVLDFIQEKVLFNAIVVMNDWEWDVASRLIDWANTRGIPTYAIVEGVNDFYDIDTGFSRRAYQRVRNLFLNGDFDKRYFSGSSQRIEVVGVERLESLAKRVLENPPIKRNLVIINCNFTYGVLSNHSEKWLSDIIKICDENSFDYLVSRHPADKTDTGNAAMSKSPLYDDLMDCDIFITRFSGAVFEALVAGCKVIYYNPGIEKIDKFLNPMGAYLYVDSLEGLAGAISKCRHGWMPDPNKFLKEHVGVEIDSNKILEFSSKKTLTLLAQDATNSSRVFDKKYSAGAVYFDDKFDEWRHFIYKKILSKGISIEYNFNNTTNVFALNFDISNLIGRVVKLGEFLYVITFEKGEFCRRLVTPKIWNDYIKQCSVDIYIIEKYKFRWPRYVGVIDSIEKNLLLLPGITFMIRAKNEQNNIKFVLSSLKNILSNKKLRCQLLFVDNNSSDDTYNEVIRVCEEQGISNVLLTSYNVDVCRSGEAHAALTNDQMHRSLDTYYNWCLDRVITNYVVKWDCDFLALQANLIQLINEYELHSSDKPLAIWCTGKTLFKAGESYFVNESTMYNEFRIFSKSHGYRWQYAPRWEICSQQYMASADKRIFSACVFLELKDLDKNEFEFRSHGAAITSDLRDRRDAEIMALIQSGSDDLIPPNLNRLDFNPLAPTNFNSPLLQGYEATLEELDALQSYWLNIYSRPQKHFRFAHKGNAVIQGLWVGEQVTNFHRLCIESFLRNGHCYVLYTYGPVGNLPEGVVIKDANKIVPSTLIYQYDGSYAGFSDLFRNKLLFDNGGWYVDLDIYCLRPFDIDSEIMFSLDHYHQDAIKARLGTDSIVDGRYYVQTNPCKLPAGHDMARSMYATIFKKIVFERIKSVWLGNQTEATESLLKGEVESNQIISALDKLQIVGDFETFVGKLSKLPNKCSFYKLLDTYDLALKDVGQKTWGEIGPIMVTREVVSRGLEKYTTKPEMFQGVVKYFEIENFVDRGFDYRTRLQEANPYSLDLFFTMWRRKGLLDKFDTTEDCLLKHIRDLVKEKLDD